MWRRSSRCDSNQCVEVFRKSSRSTGNGACVEVSTPGYRKASYSADTANCVEVGACTCDCADVLVRDSKDPDGPVLSFNAGEWSAFLAGCKAGEFDL